jgi:hypothetical protein
MNTLRQSGRTVIARPPAVTTPSRRSQGRAFSGGILIARNWPEWPQRTRQTGIPKESIRRRCKGGDGGDIPRLSWAFEPKGGDSNGDVSARDAPGVTTCHHPVPTGGDTETIQESVGRRDILLTVLTLLAPVIAAHLVRTSPHRHRNGTNAETTAPARTKNAAGCRHTAKLGPCRVNSARVHTLAGLLTREFVVEQRHAAAPLMAPLGTRVGRFPADVARYQMNGFYGGFLLEVFGHGVREVAPHGHRVPRREFPADAGR